MYNKLYMNQYILVSIITSIIFFLIKFIKMRFVDKESEPLKNIIKESGYVFISSIISGFLIDQFKFNNILENIKETPSVFTNEPGF